MQINGFDSSGQRKLTWQGLLCLGICSFFTVLDSANVFSATSTTTFQVNASIAKACVVSATTLNFNTYNPVTNANQNGTSTVSTTCTNSTTYTIGLSAGAGSGATVATRYMTSAASTQLPYSLYQDSGHSTVWGFTVGTDTVAATGSGAQQNATVYGQIVSNSYSAPGNYSDTIDVTVTY